MPACIRSLAILALGLGLASVSKAAVGDFGKGSTTRYWDCCKGSCSWPDKADVSSPVKTCSKDDSPLDDPNATSGCEGGTAYMCSDQSPWAVSSDMAYGFAAVSIPGGDESSWCCSCYELTFTTTSIAGKKMIVQATNTGGDLAQGQFDLAIPGGGVGLFNACTDQYGAPPNGWGAQYGGISTDTCSTFPPALEPGCSFRFGDFFEGADNPEVEWKQVVCPKALTDKTGCVRSGEGTSGSGGEGAGASPEENTKSPAASSATEKATTSSIAQESTAPFAPTTPSSEAAVGNSPPSHGSTSVGGGVSYSSASVSASSSSPAAPIDTPSSPSLPPYGTDAGPTETNADPEPTGGDEQCHIEYVYVDEGSM